MGETTSITGATIGGRARRAGTFVVFVVVAVIGGGTNGPALMASLAGTLASPVSVGLLWRRSRPAWRRVPASG